MRANDRRRHPTNCRVFIGNIDPSVTTEEIERIFEKFGKIVDDVRMHKGYTFIQYDNVESAEQAIRECKGYVLGGKPIDCQLAKGGQNAQRNENLGKRKHEDERENFRSRSPQYSGPPPQKRLREDELPAKPANAIPIYILSPALNNYAYYIKDTLARSNLNGVIINLAKPNELFFTSQPFFQLIENERYVLVIQQKNEQNRDVAFRAILPDGSSPGFADTPLMDVMHFVNNQPNPPALSVLPPQPMIVPPVTTSYPVIPPTRSFGTSLPPPSSSDGPNDPQLNSMILALLDKLQQPEFQQPQNYANSHSDDVASLLNTINTLGRPNKY